MRRMHEWQNAVLFMIINAINIIPVNTPWITCFLVVWKKAYQEATFMFLTTENI